MKNLSGIGCCKISVHAQGPDGGMGPDPPPPPLKNHKNIGFLSNTGPDPLNNHKATKPEFHVQPFRWRTDDSPLIVVVFGSSLLPSLTKKCCQSWITSGKTFWIRAWCVYRHILHVVDFKEICHKILPTLKLAQIFAHGLIYA